VAAERAVHLALRELTRRFGGGGGVQALSLDVAEGEVLALIGPSGSGKTTTLRLLAGFETPDAGRILVRGEDVTPRSPAARRFGMVFQHYALFPHLDVGRNVAFGLADLGLAAAEREARVQAALAAVELAGLERRAVGELSGGQQQRVALARAIAPAPAVLLLDEPLSNLDPSLRERTRRELRELIRRIGITTVLVTHEQEDAFDLGDRVALLRSGRLMQVDTPEALYRAPASLEAARFVGRGSECAAEVIGLAGDEVEIRVEGCRWRVSVESVIAMPGRTGPAILFARPDALFFAPEGGVPAVIGEARFAGAVTLYTARLASGATLEVAARPGGWRVGDAVTIQPSRRGGSGLHLFPPAVA
jgi:putative spermidine/putrescine transport system ATP-binding protein